MYRVYRYTEYPQYWPSEATVYVDSAPGTVEEYVTDNNGTPTLVGNYIGTVTYPTFASFPTVGRTNRLYINGFNNTLYRWTGSAYVSVGGTSTYTSPLTTKGDIFVRSTVDTRLPVGTDGQILTANSGVAEGLSWQDNYADWTSVVKHTVKNDGTGLITKGTAVYSTGANGTNILVGKASNTSEPTSSKTLGLMQSDITTTGGTQTGFVVTEGLLGGLNTVSAAAGDPVWLGVSGALIYGLINKPYAPAHLVFIGIVTKVSAGNGEIFVKVQNGFELKELHDVQAQSPSNNNTLYYDSATSLWKTASIATILGYTPIQLSSLSGTAPVNYNSGTGVISMAAATTSVDGYLKSADWNTFNTAYTDRNKWDGGAAGLVAVTGRTSLGASTVGGNLFTLINPNAITFIRINADNTVSTLDASTFRTAIGAGTSSTNGTVTSVSLLTIGTAGTDLTSTVANGTTTPVITLNVPTASASNRGVLSPTDWSAFTAKQAALNGTGFVKIIGTVISYDNNTYYLASNPSAFISLGALSGGAGISYNNTTGAISSTITQYTDALARAAFSELVTGLDYSSATGVLSTTAGYGIPTTASQTNWDAAYNDKINSAAVTGTTTKTLTLTQQDGGTITASWTDINTDAVTTVFGRTGAVVATEGDYSLTQLLDVTITSPTTGQVLKYNGTAWINDTDANTGTVTSVGLSSATSGVTIGSSPITTSGTITLAIATATTSQNGLLSSTDWTTFNNKANALSGTINTIAYWNSATTIASLALATYPSLTELSYVKGVTSAIQTQLNAKLSSISGIAASGDLTGTYPSPTIASGVVKLDNMSKIVANSIIGNNTGALATPTVLSGTNVTAMLDIFNGTSKGLVPAATLGALPYLFLASDGTWQKIGTSAIADQSSKTILANTSGSSGAVSAVAISSITTELSDVVGDSGSTPTKGLVPAPAVGDAAAGKFLKADGTWAVPAGGGGGGGTTTNPLIIKADSGTTEGTDLYTFDGSSAKTINIVAGTNITITKTAGTLTISSTGGSSSAVSSDHPVTLMTAFLNYT